MVLTKEVAAERLAKWRIGPADEPQFSAEGTRFRKAIDKLPAKLAKIALGFYAIDAAGKATGSPQLQWDAAIQFDRLTSRERTTILQVMFPRMAAEVEQTWVALRAAPYQSGWMPKAFRAPNDPAVSLLKRQRWLFSLLDIPLIYREEALDPAWLATWVPYLRQGWASWEPTVAPLLAATIDGGGKVGDEVFDILRQSLLNEHEIGTMGRHVVQGLLMASRPEGWELIEKTLLAAQRQEGLRQSILEAIDGAHPTAFRRMLRIVQEHDLARFSAVARAVNVWFGFAWDSVSVNVINGIIDSAATFLEDEAARKKALAGSDRDAAYLALWAIAFEDAHASIAAAKPLLTHRAPEMRFVAVTHLTQLRLQAACDAGRIATDDEDLRVALSAVDLMAIHADLRDENSDETADDVFERLERLFQRLPEKPATLKPIVWPWTQRQVAQEKLAEALLRHVRHRPPTRLLPYLPTMGPGFRRMVVELFGNQKMWDAPTRQALLGLAGDASADVRAGAFNALTKLKLTPVEIDTLLPTLTRKAADLRIGVIGLVMQQTDPQALACADGLLKSKDGNQRLAGLELLRQMFEQKRSADECRQRAAAFREQRTKPTKDEQTQLAAILTVQPEASTLTLENALGLMDPSRRTPVEPPRDRQAKLITPAAIACLKELDELIHQHREAPIITNPQSGETELLGTLRWGFPWPNPTLSPAKEAPRLPLREVWEEWFDKRPKATRDPDGCELLRAQIWREYSENWKYSAWQEWSRRQPYRRAMLAPLDAKKPVKLRYPQLVSQLTHWLLFLHPPESRNTFLLDAAETLAAAVPPQELQALPELSKVRDPFDDVEETPWRAADWRESRLISDWLSPLSGPRVILTPDEIGRLWRLGRWIDEPIAGASRLRPDPDILFQAYAAGHANLHDVADALLGPPSENHYYVGGFGLLDRLTKRRVKPADQRFLQNHPAVSELIERARTVILETELKRGEAPTVATAPAQLLGSLIGIDVLVRLLQTIGKGGFKPVTGWRSETKLQRPQTLTHLARITYPAPEETPADFVKRLRAEIAAKSFPEERLIELAFLAPQWTKFIEAYFDWEGLAEGLYWFLAHMRFLWGTDVASQAAESAGVDEEQPAAAVTGDADSDEADDDAPTTPRPQKLSAWERLIRERTALSAQDRADGAIDVQWFQRVYAALGPKRWQTLAQAAKFASNSAQAKKAQLIADVLLGQTKLADLIAGIEKRFLKDNVRLIGLYPLPKGAKRETELARRFKVLQDYARYVKQLSGLTKPQALRALEIGLQNLASTAGYADALRLDWALGVSQWADLHKGPISATKDQVTVTLSIDADVKPSVVVTRGDKPLKSVPPAVKKHKPIADLYERARELKRHGSRQKRALEAAMCRGDQFSATELQQLCRHALVAPFLERLVLIGEGIIGYPDKDGKALRNQAGKLEPIKKSEQLRIAHPHDLWADGKWSAWQKECFAAERVQPFKQIFRELYVATRQEKSTGDRSQRYAGQQVNPSQALALWGQRGWDTGDGIFKVFHHDGIVASVSFNCGFMTPLEVEGWTLESVQFSHRNEYLPMKLADVPPPLFSEVMRDMDLVVSMAHRGGVDPEASASTVEMRSALVRETCQLLGLKNVRLKPGHVLVDGKLSNYSIHLGSGTVHRMPGGALCVVPVRAQHRGRLFLPFADDDPRSAEILSKVLLFSSDHEIQDPGILEQLRA